jgi:hypothetical protein
MNQLLISKDYIPLLQTLMGGVLTFSGGLLGNFLLQKQQRNAEKINLASAFCGEIQALIRIIERRQYIRAIDLTIRGLQAGKKISLTIRITRDYLRVYDKNVDKIGILPSPLPEKIVDFYMAIVGIYEDLDLINEAGFYEQKSTKECIFILTNILSSIQLVSETGQEICQKIKHMRLQRFN